MLARDFSFKHRWTDHCHSTETKDRPLPSTWFFARFSKIPEVPLSVYVQQILWRAPWLGGFVFYSTSAGCQTEMPADVCKNKTAQSQRVMGFAAHRQDNRVHHQSGFPTFIMARQPLHQNVTTCYRCSDKRTKPSKCEWHLWRQHGHHWLTVAKLATVYRMWLVNMRMLRFFSVEKSGVISRWGQSASDQDFHTCLFFTYDTLLL